jgi:endonuclease-3
MVVMGQARKIQLATTAQHRLRELDYALDRAYGAPLEELHNKEDPLDEAIYIILTFQTDIKRANTVWAKLRSAFPTWEDLAESPVRRVARVLRAGGLHEQKAKSIKRLLDAIKQHRRRLSLDFLREMGDQEAEHFLTGLPGLSWKGARCVLLYSLDRAVFPVDGNTFRIFRRVGVLGLNAVYRRRGLHDALQIAVPPARRKAFHVNLVLHGQRTCVAVKPRCQDCAARCFCAMRGVLGRNLSTGETRAEISAEREWPG